MEAIEMNYDTGIKTIENKAYQYKRFHDRVYYSISDIVNNLSISESLFNNLTRYKIYEQSEQSNSIKVFLSEQVVIPLIYLGKDFIKQYAKV
ncbi:MAG: hypothetical protein AB7V16_12800 [Vulcanibacillus sp.]